MPTAGEEGYEKLVICPYDKAHEIRLGRLQFHLEKCRKNFPSAEMTECPFNSSHRIPRVELKYHTEEECESRSVWDKHTHEVGDIECPVKDLVPVNAATVPDGDENWDNYEAQGSVLDTIKTQAAEKNIYRMMQCESKAKRKNFRLNEAARHQELKRLSEVTPSSTSFGASNIDSERSLRQAIKPSVPVYRQNIPDALANINRQMEKELKIKDAAETKPQASSVRSDPPFASPFLAEPSTSRLTNPWAPRLGADGPMTNSAKSTTSSCSSRPSTAMSIEASFNRMGSNNNVIKSKQGFCQIPIPGIGRGKKK